MKSAQQFRQNAEACATLAESAPNAPAKNRFERLAEGWEAVAAEQEWLDGAQANQLKK